MLNNSAFLYVRDFGIRLCHITLSIYVAYFALNINEPLLGYYKFDFNWKKPELLRSKLIRLNGII